jgi:prepilin signal peptidase PulO-like enzyme (type II secretory pathway)
VVGIAPVVGALVGWCLGWVSSAATALLFREERGARWWLAGSQAARRIGLGALAPDPLVQGLLAATGALVVALTPGPWWRWLATGLLAAPLVQVAVTDLRRRVVYDYVALAGTAAGVVGSPWLHDTAWWWGGLGAALGVLLFGALYLAVRWRYRGSLELVATGDFLIVAMVGAVAGPTVLDALTAGIVASGLGALGLWLIRRDLHATMPYGPGLCLGGLLSLFLDR